LEYYGRAFQYLNQVNGLLVTAIGKGYSNQSYQILSDMRASREKPALMLSNHRF
jgi:hypothetical protein